VPTASTCPSPPTRLAFSLADLPLPSPLPTHTGSNAGTYDLVPTITNRFGGGIATITGTVGGTGPLTGLKISVGATHGGTHKDRLVDTDFNTATRLLPFCTPNPHQTASGSTFQFELDLTGVAEIKLYAKSSNGATVALEVGC
jgi:hypothetical protein